MNGKWEVITQSEQERRVVHGVSDFCITDRSVDPVEVRNQRDPVLPALVCKRDTSMRPSDSLLLWIWSIENNNKVSSVSIARITLSASPLLIKE